MGQIVKRKKKGRPSKADLAARALSAPERDIRRTLRGRNVRYNVIEYDDDYIQDDEEEEEEEEVRKREKKVKLVVKLHSDEDGRTSVARRRHAQGNDASEEEEERGKKPLKKRKINGVDDADFDSDNIDDNNDNRDDQGDDDDDEVRIRMGDTTGQDSAPGAPTEAASELRLPDKKVLELILDKLQKKDIYGVYAEPVDLEELPDYLDYIDNPMDFATVRKKLANGSYSTLEQFESDVFLICSNAMQYNAPETIYYKQARSIEELATRKFQRLRANIERAEKEMKAEQGTKLNSLGKNQIKKPLGRTVQEPVGSDFLPGATLATHGDVQNGSAANQASGCEQPFATDGPLEGNYFIDNNLDKMEDMPSGKVLPSKLGRKPYIVDENRRATYNISDQTVSKSDSIFTTFDNEVKQLVAVGLHAEYAYARSLAHFAATLGPVAWRMASQRIEQALPAGFKFGRGWVGEYEPLPTSVLMLEPQTQTESHFLSKAKSTADAQKVDMTSKTHILLKERPLSGPGKEHFVPVKNEHFLGRPPKEPFAPGKEHRVGGSVREHFVPVKDHPVSGLNSEGKPPLFHHRNGSVLGAKQSLFESAGMVACNPAAVTYLQQNLPFRNTAVPENKVTKQVELNLSPAVNQHDASLVADKQLSNNSEMPVSRSREMVPKNLNLPQPLPFKQPDYNGIDSRGLPNGQVTGNPLNSGFIGSTDTVSNQVTKVATYLAHGQEKNLGDPVELMRRLAENGQKHQRSTNHTPADSPSVAASAPSGKNDSSNASSTAARAWIPIGAAAFKQPTENSGTHKTQISAESLYNPTRQLHPQSPLVQAQSALPTSAQLSDKNSFQFQVFPPQPFRLGNDSRLQDRPMVFPQLVRTDFSRFHPQSPWQGLSPHSQPMRKQDTLPPDLNIGFQPPGSPVKQSANGIMESQLPDLALQL